MGQPACVGRGARHQWPLCLVFKASIFLGLKPRSLLTILDITRPHGRCGQLGFVDGQVSAWVRWQPPGAEPYLCTHLWLWDLLALCVPHALPHLGVHILQFLCKRDKVRSQSVTAQMDFENTTRDDVRCTCRSPLSSEHPAVLRTDLPQAALCRDLSWARCGA